MQEWLLRITIAMTVGVFVGFVAGLIRKMPVRRKPTEPADGTGAQDLRPLGYVMFFAFLVLLVGLFWTAYFLVLGLVDPAQTEYAANASSLIVGVLTVFSIIVAFVEFWRRK